MSAAPKFTLLLTAREVRALAALAGEGGEGLLTDASAARSYIGDAHDVAAAYRALRKLNNLAVDARAALAKVSP